MRELSQIYGFASKLFADVTVPKWAIAVASAIAGYFFPTTAQQAAALGALYLVVVDTLSGLVAQRVQGKAITSSKLSRAITKVCAYFSVISVAAVVTRHIAGAASYQGMTVTGVLGLIIGAEGWSILENVRAMGVDLPFGINRLLEDRLRAATGMTEEAGSK